MNTNAATIPFACPRCDQKLDQIESGHRCEGCKLDFPLIGGLPWLFAEPNAVMAEWRSRYDYLLQALAANQARYLEAAGRDGTSAETRARLELLASTTQDHISRLSTFLAPLGEVDPPATVETYLALRTRLPPDQGLATYYPNIHRDWCWGDEENEASLRILLQALGDRDPGRTLFLGAGAGRLAFDFHQQTTATTVALDFNPLLVMLGKRICDGETLELNEFPMAPLDFASLAPLRTLKAPTPARDGLNFVVADVHRAPFAAKSFDTVVTPWLVDILPGKFDELCARVNHWLDDNGTWLNFGSLNFHHSDPAAQLGPDECIATLQAQGFETPATRNTTIPYLCSPASRHSRQETVFSWRADKQTHQKKVSRHQALPDWIVKRKDPVPALEHFRVAAATTRIHAHIMSLIDGKRSIADIAKLLEKQRLMPAADAESAIQGLMIKLFDESQVQRP